MIKKIGCRWSKLLYIQLQHYLGFSFPHPLLSNDFFAFDGSWVQWRVKVAGLRDIRMYDEMKF